MGSGVDGAVPNVAVAVVAAVGKEDEEAEEGMKGIVMFCWFVQC